MNLRFQHLPPLVGARFHQRQTSVTGTEQVEKQALNNRGAPTLAFGHIRLILIRTYKDVYKLTLEN